MDNGTRAWLIGFHRRMSAYHRGKMLEVVNGCPHDISESSYGGARCSICNSLDLGWYCPDSPTNLCKYPGFDVCIYCGEPQERK